MLEFPKVVQRLLKIFQPRAAAVQRLIHVSRKSHGLRQPADRRPFVDSLYSEGERGKILDVFNNWSNEELQCIQGMTKKRLESLEKYRADHGSHVTLSNVVRVSGITILTLERMCKAILSGRVERKKLLEKPSAMLCYPSMPTELCQTAENLVSISISADTVYWSQLATSARLMDWNHLPLWGRDAKPPRFDFVVYSEAVSRVVEKLPKSAIYVTERGSPKYFQGGSSQSILMSNIIGGMTAALLYGRLNVGSMPRIFTLPSQNVTRQFKLMIGGERVSGQSIVHNLVYNGHHEKIAVEVPAFLRESFVQQDASTKEYLSNCLLQAVTFMELVVKPLASSASSASEDFIGP